MRITAKQLANLALVVVLGVVATTWAVFGLADLSPFDHPRHVTVRLAETGGALPGAEVTYLGVSIGQVTDARLVDDEVELRLEIEPKGPMARELRADVRQKTSLGEPYVDLAPAFAGAPAGDVDGAVVPADRTSTPPSLGALFRSGSALLDHIDPEAFATVVEGASGLAGHTEDLRDILSATAAVGDVVADRRVEIERLLAASATVVDTLATHADAIGSAASGASQVGAVLAGRIEEIRSILRSSATLGTEGTALLAAIEADLDNTLAGLETAIGTLADRPQSLDDILVYTPLFVDELGRTFEGGTVWSSVQGVPGIPFSPVYGIPIVGSGLRIDKLLLPSVAERLYVDGGGSMPTNGIMLISPEEAWALWTTS